MRSHVSIRGVLNGKKKVFQNQFSQKSPRALHVLNHGWWQLAVGGGWRLAVRNWRLVAVGGGWRRLVAGGWWLEAVGSGWQLAVGRRWRLAAVGGWRLVAVGSPLGRSLRAVLSKKKKSRPLRTSLVSIGAPEDPQLSLVLASTLGMPSPVPLPTECGPHGCTRAQGGP